MSKPEELKFAESHEWVRKEGNTAYVGISDHAQDSLGDIVFVELPEVGMKLKKGEEVANIESVKAAAPINAPISGKVLAVNEDLEDNPESINSAPYETHIFSIEISDPSEMDALLDYDSYQKFIENEA